MSFQGSNLNHEEHMSSNILFVGLLFPLLGWLTFALSRIQYARTGRASSGIYIPFIGPILIDIWLFAIAAPTWTLLIPWIADIGTIAFVYMTPRLLHEFWRTSCFTRIAVLEGMMSNMHVRVSLHRNAHYLLEKRWSRPPNETGILKFSEIGTYRDEGSTITLTSSVGAIRRLQKQCNDYVAEDTELHGPGQINGWTLHLR